MSILLSNLYKTFNDMPVVTNLNLEIEDGELFVLLGGSGSGKSTVLRMIAGLTQPDSGRIDLHGRDVTNLSVQARGTGFVFQNYSIFRHMTISDNIQFGLLLRKVPKAERIQKANQLMELVGLSGLGERYPDQLSGGQRQRVALARALAYEPSVLLLDEPFGALDVKIRGHLRRSLREIQQELKVTTILVTHDQEEGFELADRIGVLERGSLIEVGTPESLYQRPNSQFVATFVGGGNVLVGSISQGHVKLGRCELPLPDSAPPHLEGARARVLIRPEHLAVTPAGQVTPDGFRLGSGRVLESSFVGAIQRLRLELPDLDGVRCIAPTPAFGQEHPQLEASLPGSPRLTRGDKVEVGLTHFHVLERTGLRSLVWLPSPDTGTPALEYACGLAEATKAPLTVLNVRKRQQQELEIKAWLEPLLQSPRARSAGPKLKLRQGPEVRELLAEIREGMHELLILSEPAGPRFNRVSQRLLTLTDIPCLLVPHTADGSSPSTGNILILTRGGEPGKADVWLGGRLAKRANAQVTVAYAHTSGVNDPERQRAERHLQAARQSLAGLGVATETRILEGEDVVSVLTREAVRGGYDLVVMGASAPTPRSLQLIRSLSQPVLLVPLKAEG